MRCEVHHRDLVRLGDKQVCPACLAGSSKGAQQVWSLMQERNSAHEHRMRLLDAGIPDEFANKTFANFVAEGDKATKLVRVLEDYCSGFAQARLKRKGFLFIGAPGTAKTHLACAMVTAIVDLGLRAGYVSLPRFTRDVRAAYGKPRGVDDLLRKLIALDFLAIDEIDLHGTSDNDYAMLYDIINGRYEQSGHPTLAISNRPLDHLQRDLDERVVSRILAGTAPIECDWPARRNTRRRGAMGAAQ